MPFSFSIPEPYDARMSTKEKAGTLPPNTSLSVSETENIIPSTSSYTTTGAQLASSTLASPQSRFLSQFGLFATGAAATALSVLITRRSVAHRIAAIRPKGIFTPSNRPLKVNGGAEAAEALGLATLNVASFAFMITTGLMWALDISGLNEMRTRMRKQMGLGVMSLENVPKELQGKDGAVKDDDVEMWMNVVSARMQGKSDEEIEAMVMSRVDDAGEKP